MAKMINVDELIEFCNTERAMLHARGNSVTCAALRRVVEFAKEYAVEAEPVKHGRWIVTKTERGWNCAEYPVEWTCSECKVANDRKDDFCPHCGSYNRMDGDSE